MLVLTRKTNESIHIGPDIRIVIIGVDRGHVRIGIDAPESVLILRGELVPPPKPKTDQIGGG